MISPILGTSILLDCKNRELAVNYHLLIFKSFPLALGQIALIVGKAVIPEINGKSQSEEAGFRFRQKAVILVEVA